MSKEWYIETGYYFCIGSTEEIVQKRRDEFISSYGASDNCLCQLLHCKCQLSVYVFDLYLMYLFF